MATNETLKNEMQGQLKQPIKPEQASLQQLLDSPQIKKRISEILGQRAPQFAASLINLYKSDDYLKKCKPVSIVSSAMIAATMDLPVDKNLGYAWIVPYKDEANFQIGYKGLIQLALRTGQYQAINVLDVHEGELVKWNPLTEDFEMDFDAKKSDAVIGYVGYFKLLNGFEKTVYWSKKDVEDHKKKFSKSDFGWKNNWDAMARKTVIRNMLSKWGILSIQMQNAVSFDVSTETGETRKNYIEANDGSIIDLELNADYEIKNEI